MLVEFAQQAILQALLSLIQAVIPPIVSRLSEWVARVRQKSRLTQRNLGKLLDRSETQVARWERGITEPPVVIQVQIKALEVSIGVANDPAFVSWLCSANARGGQGEESEHDKIPWDKLSDPGISRGEYYKSVKKLIDAVDQLLEEQHKIL